MRDDRPPTKDELVEWRLRALETDVERLMEAREHDRDKAGALNISRGALIFAGVQTFVSVATLLTVLANSGS